MELSKQALETRRFNDDLLMGDGDLDYARNQFPKIIHLLDNPELRFKFLEYEEMANKARVRVRRLGLIAVLFGTLALLSAASEPFWHIVPEQKVIGTIFELFGMSAAAIAGMGLFFGPWRKIWMEARFMTERLRQWHFQVLVRKGMEIEASLDQGNPRAIEAFLEQRRRWFAEFLQEHVGKLDSRVTLLANDPDDASSDWLLSPKTSYPVNSHALPRVFEAYHRLRLKHQLDYVTHKLTEDEDKPHWQFLSWPVLRQESTIRSVVSFCFFSALLCSVTVIFNQWAEFRPHYAPHLGSVALMIAIVGIAFRTIQDGLGISKDIERYRDYRGKVRRLRDAFELPTSQTERVKVMEDLELEVVDELRGFLRTHREASFVL